MDDFNRQILEEEIDRTVHPVDWEYRVKCRECGSETISGSPKTEILKYRKLKNLAPGTPVVLESTCAKCGGPDDEEH